MGVKRNCGGGFGGEGWGGEGGGGNWGKGVMSLALPHTGERRDRCSRYMRTETAKPTTCCCPSTVNDGEESWNEKEEFPIETGLNKDEK